MLKDDVIRGLLELVDAGYPESVAKRIASGELPMDNASRMARAAEQGHTETMYHGSMQDITGEYIPRYSDGMMFVTPSPQFASDWAGKGAMQTRAGELDSYDRAKPQIDALYAQMGSPEAFTPEYDKFDELRKIIMQQERNAFKTVYPLAVRTGNIFDPSAAGAYEDVTKPLFERLGRNPDEIEQYLRDANYLTFEDADVASELRKLGYDSVRLREDVSKPADTVAMLDGSANVRSLLAAAFDPEYKGKNILGINGGSNGVAGKIVDTASTAAQNAAIDYALSQASDRAPDLGSIEPVEPGYRDRARDYIAEALGGERKDYRMAEKLMSVGDYLPFVGGASGAADTVDAYNEGDVLGTVLGAAGVLAGAIPAGRAAYDGLLGIIERAPEVTRDTRLLQRVGDPKSVNAMELDVEPGQELAPARPLRAEDLEGRGFVSGMSDTSRGDLSRIVGVNGLPIDMTRYGGQDYMRQLQNLEQGILWASDQGQITGLLNAATEASRLPGVSRSPLYIPYQMGPTSTDFSTMTADFMVPVAKQNMSKKDKKALDKRIREGSGKKKDELAPQPDWPGIDSPDADTWLANAGGNRKAVTKAIDEFRDVAGINLSQARAAIVDPSQMNPRVGNLMQAGVLDLSKPPQLGMHPSYNTDLMGHYLGQFGEGANLLDHLNPLIRSSGEPFVPAMLARGHNLSAEKLPSPVGKAMQAGLIGRFDQESIDRLIKEGLVAP